MSFEGRGPSALVLVPNPRTPARPMAFTGGEYWRGLWWTLVVFNVGFPLLLILWMFAPQVLAEGAAAPGEQWGVSLVNNLAMTAMFAIPISGFAAVAYGGFAAYGLGLLLRRVASRWLHRTAFFALGVGVGAVAVLLFGLTLGGVPLGDLIYPAALWTGVSVCAGWGITSRRALRADAGEGVTVAVDEEEEGWWESRRWESKS